MKRDDTARESIATLSAPPRDGAPSARIGAALEIVQMLDHERYLQMVNAACKVAEGLLTLATLRECN